MIWKYQAIYSNSLTCSPIGVAWKLYPPRLRPNAHEIFIDNDLIIDKLPVEIEIFLQSNNYFIYTEGLHVNTKGRFNWPIGKTFNSGLFGIPPNFDFKEQIENKLKDQLGWTDYFDEQGLVGEILLNQNNVLNIDLKTIGIFEEAPVQIGLHGYHFVKANSGTNTAWNHYTRKKKSSIAIHY
jgi:hypothetical protein